MRTVLAALLVLGLSATGRAGTEPAPAPAPAGEKPAQAEPTRPAHSEQSPKANLERPAQEQKPADDKALCTLVSPDQNAPADRKGCIAARDPEQPRGAEKTPPAAPGSDAVASAH